jgi:hypothetical protein
VHPAFVTDFSGTSAAAPMVAGVAALMLEANPRLGWRDVQEILAHTARHVGSPIGGGPVEDEAFSWSFNGATTWNGGGLHFSNDYGFGLVDARAAVRLAESWRQQQTSTTFATEIETWRGVRPVDRLGAPVLVDFETEADLDLEMVGIELVPSAGVSIAEYRVTLTSPSGTESVLATPVRGVEQLTGWIFGSRAFLGEEAEGTWTLTVSDGIRNGPGGALLEARLYLLGGDGDAPRTHVFTDAFSDYVDAGFGHGRTIVAGAGGADGLNTAAVRGGVGINIAEGTGRIDGEAVRLAGTFARVDTGDGADLIVGGAASELLAGWRGNDVIRGNGGSDRLIGGPGRDRLEGGSGIDMLFAGGGPDSVFGGRGPDRLIGGAGNDRLHGGPGRDVLADGEGADILFGGTDADRFVLVRDGQRDAIRDFEDGLDRIELAGPGFGALVRETLEPGRVLVRSPGDVLLVEDGGAGQLRARDLGSEDFLFA